MKTTVNAKKFTKTMNNIIDYSFGFIDGTNRGKQMFFDSLGKQTVEVLKKYIDTNARMNPNLLHHVYEWYQTGSPKARLYELNYTSNSMGVSFKSTFKQSTSIPNGSKVPFYNKASIMEQGSTVIIKPKKTALAFEVDGEEVFTRKPVTVQNPGGEVSGEFEKIFDSFFNQYFRQSFLKASGLFDYLENPTIYKKNFRTGAKIGRSAGVSTGIAWMANARIAEVE